MVEVFTSAFRGIGIAVVSVIGGFGSMAAPFVSSEMDQMGIYPQIFFGAFSILGILITFPAEETFGKGLAEEKEEESEFEMKNSNIKITKEVDNNISL